MKLLKPAWIHHGGTDKPIMSADIHPDGSRLATGGQGDNGGLIVLWNMEPIRNDAAENDGDVPKVLTRLQAHTRCVNCVRWSHSGSYLASCSDDRIVMIWQLVGRIAPIKQSNNNQNGDAAKKSSEKVSSAFGGASIETWRCAHSLSGHQGDVLHVDWSVRDEFLASASIDNTAIIWSVARGERLATLAAHTGLVKGVAFDPVGKYVATQSDDRTLRVWRTSDWRCEAVITAPFRECDSTTHVLRLGWAVDGRSIMSAHAMNNRFPVVQLIDRSEWRLSVDLVGHRKAVTVVRVLPRILRREANAGTKDGEDNYEQCSAVGSRDRSISIWLNSLNRPLVVLHDLFTDSVLDLTWNVFNDSRSPNGGGVQLELVAASHDGSVAFIAISEQELASRRLLPRDATDAFLRSLYGASVPAFRDSSTTFAAANGHTDSNTQRSRLIEHADVLELHSRSANSVNQIDTRLQPQVVAKPREPAQPRPTEQCEARTKEGRRRITPAFVANLLTTVEPIAPVPTSRVNEPSDLTADASSNKPIEFDGNAEKLRVCIPTPLNAASPSKTTTTAASINRNGSVPAPTPASDKLLIPAAAPAQTIDKAEKSVENDKEKEREKEKEKEKAAATLKRKLADSSVGGREKEKDKPVNKKVVIAAAGESHDKSAHAHEYESERQIVISGVPSTPAPAANGGTLADALLRTYLKIAQLRSSGESGTSPFSVPITSASCSTTESSAADSDNRPSLGDILLVETGARACRLSRAAHFRKTEEANAESQSQSQSQPSASNGNTTVTRWSVLLDGRIVALAIDSNSQLVCAARADATLQLRELDSGALISLPILLDGVASHLQFLDSSYLLVVTELGTVTVWRIAPDAADADADAAIVFSSNSCTSGLGGFGNCANSAVSMQTIISRQPLVADLLRHAALRLSTRVSQTQNTRVNDVAIGWSVRDDRLLVARATVTVNGAATRNLAAFAIDSRTLHAFSTDLVHISSFCNTSFLNVACSKLEQTASGVSTGVSFANFDVLPLRSAFERCSSYLDRFANDVPSAKESRIAPGSFGEAVASEREHATANRLRVVEELICFARLARDEVALKRWFALYVHCLAQSCADESDRAAQSLANAINKHVINVAPAQSTSSVGFLRFVTDADRRRYATMLLGLIGANVHLQRLFQALKFTLDAAS